ncbi:LCP family protein [Nocardioides speluncae]|uniref:LCP family protein n=1 Tax=Nocardioides speluncae TaxID=2670337 RepID=UPI001F0B901A|nr:LCP family protein [Nocardioides speluncae]
MTLVLPGSAQLAAGNKTIGRIALRIWAGLAGLVVLVVLITLAWHGFALWLGLNATLLSLIRITLMILAVAWAALFFDAWRLGEPLTLRQGQRLTVVGVNGVLCLSVAGTLLFGAHVVGVQRDFIVTTFGSGKVSDAEDGRYNVLLLGGDSGKGRWGLRPDSLTVASIDAETGKTVLVGLPRNMANFEFADGSVMDEQFPDGFDCDGCLLNGVSTWALDNKELFGDSKTPGIDATVSAVEGITDLKISYWAMVNLEGFKELVDAVGGVTLNVRDKIPVGLPHEDFFHYIEPGKKKLNGFDALWFARAREGSDDYSRMARQKCVMNALLTQVSPQTAVRNFEKIMKATSGMLSTNLPASELARFIDLAGKAKEQKMSTVSLVPPTINTADPDIDKIHDMVEDAIDRAEGKKDEKAKPKKKPKSTTGGSIGSRDEGYAANQADDLGAAC